MSHTIGILLSALGIILTSIGVVGDERLEKWENKLRDLSNQSWRLFDLRTIQKLGTNLLGLSLLLSCGIVGTGLIVSTFDEQVGSSATPIPHLVPPTIAPAPILNSSSNQDPVYFAIILTSIICGGAIFGVLAIFPIPSHIFLYILRFVLWIIFTPYRIMGVFIERTKMKSTLQVFGIIISILGLLLT